MGRNKYNPAYYQRIQNTGPDTESISEPVDSEIGNSIFYQIGVGSQATFNTGDVNISYSSRS